MQIATQEVRDGKHNDKILWICHYNRPDMSKKALRNLPPTRVIVVDNDALPKGKRVYYSVSHFRPLSKDGNPLARIISAVDNTGYRSYCGNEIHVFEEEEECKTEWNKQVKGHMQMLDPLIESAAARWENEKNELAKYLF